MLERLVYRHLTNKTVLIVDDDSSIRTVLKKQLMAVPGLLIKEASDGKYAIDRLNESDVDCVLVISDINMGHMNGFELLKAIRSGDTRAPRDLPIVLISSTESLNFKDLAARLDANAYIVKPISYAVLIDTLADTISRPITLMSPSNYAKMDIQSTISLDR